MSGVYIASHDQRRAAAVAADLRAAGHRVVSSWHDDRPFRGSDDKAVQAAAEFQDVRRCHALVLLADDDRVPPGKFLVAGAALALGKDVIILGRRETWLLEHPSVVLVDGVSSLKSVLGAA